MQKPILSDVDVGQLRSVRLFSSLCMDDIKTLRDKASLLILHPLEYAFHPEDAADHLCIVTEGTVGLMAMIDDNQTILLELIGAGHVIGEAGLFDTGHHPFGAQAITKARLMLIPADLIHSYLNTRPDMRRQMLSFLSSRLRGLVHQIAQLKLMSASQRLGSFLLSLTERRPGHHTIHLNCDRQTIARMLGMKPETLSRAFHELKKIGIYKHGNMEIVVEDARRLKLFVSGLLAN